MKTITAFLLGILFTSLTILLMVLATNSIDLSTNYYTIKGSEQQYDFFLTFLFTAIAQLIVAIVTSGLAVKSFQVFYSYYTMYMLRKRDNDITKQLIEANYNNLYEALRGTNIHEEKVRIIKEFYSKEKEKGHKVSKELFEQALKDLIK